MLSDLFMSSAVPLEHVILGGICASITLFAASLYLESASEADKAKEEAYLLMLETLYLTKLAVAQKMSQDMVPPSDQTHPIP